MALGAGMAITSLSSCSTLPIIKSEVERDRIFVDPVNFAESNSLLIRTKRLDHDILLIKNTDDTYRALYMSCTHNHFSLSCNKSQIFCTSHGAEFDFDGNVTRGPAKKQLHRFPVTSENGKIVITIS